MFFCVVAHSNSFSAAQGITPGLSKIQQACIGAGVAGVVSVVVFSICTLSLLVMMSRRYRDTREYYQVEGFHHTAYEHENQQVQPEYNIQPEYRLRDGKNQRLEDDPRFQLGDAAGFNVYDQYEEDDEDNELDEPYWI
jgi:hypothetical protein